MTLKRKYRGNSRRPGRPNGRSDFEAHLNAVVKLFNSPTGQLIRELVAESQSDEAIAQEFRQRFWQPRRDLSLARLQHGIATGQVRPDIDHEIVLDAIYGPLWLRLMVGHLPVEKSAGARIVSAIWQGIKA